jgi:predicted AlkP superfamily phosphohydrolase/phosphomutase
MRDFQPMSNRTILIGWGGADWRIMDPLLERGLMPHTKRLIDEGVAGDLAPLKPIVAPALWNSISTGKRPAKHGIKDYTEPQPDGRGIRVASSTSRKCKALWNIASQEGLATHAVNWYASHPAEPIAGVCVSQAYADLTAPHGEAWPMPKGSVYPKRIAETLSQVRVHPGDLDRDVLLPFIPLGAEIDQGTDHRVTTLSKIIARAFSTQAAITAALEQEPWDFAAVLYDSIESFSNAFMWYHAPQMEGVPAEDVRMYRDVINGAYCLQDLLLGKVLALAGDETNVVIVSDHGFYGDHLRSLGLGGTRPDHAVDQQSCGVAILNGPDVKQGQRLRQASILDVAPTILTLLGLPVGEDMDGRVWSDALEGDPIPATIPTWEQIPGRSGMHEGDDTEETHYKDFYRYGAITPGEASAAAGRLLMGRCFNGDL